jgi:NAD(P)-dependent dehydrogenase (short-subunit alcohol dehydrogenase family)
VLVDNGGVSDPVGRLSGRVCVITGAAGGVGRATAGRLAAEGARVVGVDLVDTPALRELFADDPEKVARRNVHMPMGRFGRVEEVAATVAFLASDDAGYVTASAFPLDGGITSAYAIPG